MSDGENLFSASPHSKEGGLLAKQIAAIFPCAAWVTQNAQHQQTKHWKQNRDHSYLCTCPGFGYYEIMA